MTNKEFVDTLAQSVSLDIQATQRLGNCLIDSLVQFLDEGCEVGIQGFGSFDVKKKNERVIVHPASGEKMLVPPKVVPVFKQSSVLRSQVLELGSGKTVK